MKKQLQLELAEAFRKLFVTEQCRRNWYCVRIKKCSHPMSWWHKCQNVLDTWQLPSRGAFVGDVSMHVETTWLWQGEQNSSTYRRVCYHGLRQLHISLDGQLSVGEPGRQPSLCVKPFKMRRWGKITVQWIKNVLRSVINQFCHAGCCVQKPVELCCAGDKRGGGFGLVQRTLASHA